MHTVKLPIGTSPDFDSLQLARPFACNLWGISNDKCGTLSSTGDYGVAFQPLARAVYGVGQAFSFTGKFCDFGFGDGIVLFLAAMTGFDSYGSEMREEGFKAANKSLETEWLAPIREHVHLHHGDFKDWTEDFYSALSVWYLYPSSGSTKEVLSLFERFASDDALLVMKDNGELRCYDYHQSFPHSYFQVAGALSRYCFLAKKQAVVDRVIGFLSADVLTWSEP